MEQLIPKKSVVEISFYKSISFPILYLNIPNKNFKMHLLQEQEYKKATFNEIKDHFLHF